MPAALNRALYFSLQAAIGSRAGAAYRELMTLERAPRPQIDDLAEQRLGALLQRAVRSVPYYRDRVNPAAADDLAAFPVLTKQAIHENFSDLMTPELRAAYDARRRSPAYSWVAVQTGGSTGAPSTVIHDRALRDHGRAGRAYAQYLCGFPFGTPYLRLWGSMADIRRSKSSPVQRIIHALSRETVLNAFMLNAQRMQTYLGAINGSRCRHMMAYADAAHRLALFAEEAGIAVRPLQTIMSCASTLTDDIRETLQRVFGARIHNKYGSRECTDMACECEAGGLHVLEPTLRLEVADGNGRALPAGERGRILVTSARCPTGPVRAVALSACWKPSRAAPSNSCAGRTGVTYRPCTCATWSGSFTIRAAFDVISSSRTQPLTSASGLKLNRAPTGTPWPVPKPDCGTTSLPSWGPAPGCRSNTRGSSKKRPRASSCIA